MEARVNNDEFAIMDWLHQKKERAAPDVQDFLASVLRDQLKMSEAQYNRARDFLQHFQFVELRQAELDSGEKVEAIKLTPNGENFFRHAVCEPKAYRFDYSDSDSKAQP